MLPGRAATGAHLIIVCPARAQTQLLRHQVCTGAMAGTCVGTTTRAPGTATGGAGGAGTVVRKFGHGAAVAVGAAAGTTAAVGVCVPDVAAGVRLGISIETEVGAKAAVGPAAAGAAAAVVGETKPPPPVANAPEDLPEAVQV